MGIRAEVLASARGRTMVTLGSTVALGSPSHAAPFSQCWHVQRGQPSEADR